MPTINIPSWLRFTLYATTAIGTPVMVYLKARGIVGELEMNLFYAESSVVATMAAIKTTKEERPVESPHEPAYLEH